MVFLAPKLRYFTLHCDAPFLPFLFPPPNPPNVSHLRTFMFRLPHFATHTETVLIGYLRQMHALNKLSIDCNHVGPPGFTDALIEALTRRPGARLAALTSRSSFSEGTTRCRQRRWWRWGFLEIGKRMTRKRRSTQVWLYLHGHGARDVDEAVLQALEVILDYRIYP